MFKQSIHGAESLLNPACVNLDIYNVVLCNIFSILFFCDFLMKLQKLNLSMVPKQ